MKYSRTCNDIVSRDVCLIFVSKYQLELPKKVEMEKFLEEQVKGLGYGG